MLFMYAFAICMEFISAITKMILFFSVLVFADSFSHRCWANVSTFVNFICSVFMFLDDTHYMTL